jgi:HD-GYP domain-containing protein (c-di-GMP phosphodiesterase class II)/DNA-binding CsgD family transcriptional regulator
MATVDFGRPDQAVAIIEADLAAHAPAAARRAAISTLLGQGREAAALHDAAQCDAGERLAGLLPVSPGARVVVTDAFERWDGHGGPAGKQGEELALVARLVEVAYVAELFRCRQGRGGAVAELRARAGAHLDPSLVARFLDGVAERFDLVDDARRSVWETLLASEPEPWARVSPSQVDGAALAFARFADLKSTFFTGHSEAVASLAVAAGASLGLDAARLDRVRRAALLHDVGRTAIPTGTWDLPRGLSGPEFDRVRFHAWETQRILAATPLLAPLAGVASGAHERSDGTGYHRGLDAAALDAEVRLLAAADVACALREERPHRPALPPEAATDVLRDEVEQGRLDRRAVAAVLEASGAGPMIALSWPTGLTDREVDVLRLVATGATNKDVARALGITAKTVAHHVAHIYDKTGCRSRAGVTLFALEHGLVGPGSTPHP